MKVWVLTICNNFGCSAFVYSNKQACTDHLYQYVQEWWCDVEDNPDIQLDDGNCRECPDDPQEAIELYFNNHPEGETANIEELPILDHQ
jgi:hypothetical protein